MGLKFIIIQTHKKTEGGLGDQPTNQPTNGIFLPVKNWGWYEQFRTNTKKLRGISEAIT